MGAGHSTEYWLPGIVLAPFDHFAVSGQASAFDPDKFYCGLALYGWRYLQSHFYGPDAGLALVEVYGAVQLPLLGHLLGFQQCMFLLPGFTQAYSAGLRDPTTFDPSWCNSDDRFEPFGYE